LNEALERVKYLLVCIFIMAQNRPPPKRVLLPGAHYLKSRLSSIPTGSKARFAIAEAKRFGATGQELKFALMSIKHRVLLTGRQMQEGLSFQKLQALQRLNEATGVGSSTERVLKMIDDERAAIGTPKKTGKVEKKKKPSIKLKDSRKNLAASIESLISFGWDPNIKTRYHAFNNLMKETQKQECEQVCEWLEAMGDYYMQRARIAQSYSQHANQADFSMRCYGAAGFLYGKHGFKDKEFESQKLGYALNARLGHA